MTRHKNKMQQKMNCLKVAHQIFKIISPGISIDEMTTAEAYV
jgi:hypothetical protein